MKKLISIVTSAHNEEKGLHELAARLIKVIDKLKKYDFEIIIIDNGSTDKTYPILQEIHRKDKRFKIVQLSRDFHGQGGYSAALSFARGDAAIIMHSDLQDPPEIIPKFIEKWEAGYENIYGIITKREGVSRIRKIVSPLFYYVIGLLTHGQLHKNASDFRLITKKVYTVVNSMPEHGKYLRGVIAWVGFRQIGIPYKRKPRYAKGGCGTGAERYNPIKFVIDVARVIFNSVFSFSTFPLKLITILGITISFFSFGVAFYYILYYVLFGTANPGYVRGYTSTLVIILCLFGILFLSLGMVGEYVARIYEEVKNRPSFIVKNTIGIDNEKRK